MLQRQLINRGKGKILVSRVVSASHAHTRVTLHRVENVVREREGRQKGAAGDRHSGRYAGQAGQDASEVAGTLQAGVPDSPPYSLLRLDLD